MAALLAARSAPAMEDEAARSIAQPLFDDGVKLMAEGHCDDETLTPERRPKCREALAKFKKAFDIYPAGLGALRNAAFCERGLGMVASAMRDFREVARRAPLDASPSKQLWGKHAADEADKLGALVPHVTLNVETPPPGLMVKVDEGVVPPAAYGVAIPLDPGDHVVVAAAPGFVTSRWNLDVEPKEEHPIAIRLVPLPLVPPPRAAGASYTAPIVLIGVGMATFGTGLALGLAAKHARDDACEIDAPLRCRDQAGLDRARDYARASTVTTVVGAALIATGVVVVVAKSARGRDLAVVLRPLGAGISGGF